tara:strand:+ start:192 stop:635 length:444 start_codon:yes stop_codon:yes gene_type:complete
MQLHDLKPNKRKTSKRIGRGGKRGTYSGRGVKGQRARSGGRVRPGFEGGQTPLWRRVQKQGGFRSLYLPNIVINISVLNHAFEENDIIDIKALQKKGLIGKIKTGKKGPAKIKILGNGDLEKRLVIKGCLVSKKAKEKILKFGGKIE